jgi:Tfp pilus assembly protein PilW
MIYDLRIKNLDLRKALKIQAGVTLIEMLLYMGIFSILLMVMVQLFGSIVNINLESQANAAVSQDGRYILSQMTYTLRQATTYTLPATLGTNGVQLQFSTGAKTYTYSLSSDPLGQQKLLVNDGTTTEQLNSYGTTVSNLSFVRLKSTTTTGTPKQTITISFTLTSTTREQKGTQQETFTTTVGGR